MIRPRQVRLKLNKSQFQYCQKLSQESAKVWNSVKNFFWRTYRKKGIWLSESSLKRYIQGRFALHSQSIQAIVEKFYTNLKAAHTLRKNNPDIRYPYKSKKWFCIHWKKKALKIDGRYIHLSNGRGRQGIIFKLPVYLANCQPRCVELIWRNGYWLSVTLEVEGKQQVLSAGVAVSNFPGFSTAAVDMQETTHAFGLAGEIHAITITDGKESAVISGRELRSAKRYRNKQVAQLSRQQSRCQKGSRRWKRLQAVKSKVMAECHRRTRDLNHKITRIAVDWCIQHNIGKLIIGDVTGISKNTKNEKRLNKKNRQKISQWSFYQQRQYMEYKCSEIGIETILESEAGTSKTCPRYVRCAQPQTGAFAGLRRDKYKPNGRNYNCQACNLKMAVHAVTAERSEHRDVVGACNIRTKHLTGVLSGDDNFQSPTVKYLRIDHWSKSSSAAGVSRRKKSFRRRLGVPEQLTLLPLSTGGAIQSRMFNEA